MNSLAIDSMANVVVAACLILMFIETKTHFTAAKEEEGFFSGKYAEGSRTNRLEVNMIR